MSKGRLFSKTITDMIKEIKQSRGAYEAKRLERAADEVPNLERLYQKDALDSLFRGENAKGIMTMRPEDFEKYAVPLGIKSSVGPKAAELARSGDISKGTVTTDEYIKHLQGIRGGFNEVPFLNVNKEEAGLPLLPYITGHEGRHRMRALAGKGQPSALVRFEPRAELREPFPRRSREEYIEAIKKELGLTDNMVRPEAEDISNVRPAIKLPDVYKGGGAVRKADGGAATYNEAMLRRTGKFSQSDLDKMRRELEENARRIAAEKQAMLDNPPPAEMTEYNPTLQQRLGSAAEKGLKAIGAATPRARELSDILTGGRMGSPLPLGMSVMDFTPAAIPVYGGQGVMNAAEAAGKGNYGEAALELGLAGIDLAAAYPATKALAKSAKPMVKAGAKAMAPKVDDLAMQYMMKAGMALPMADLDAAIPKLLKGQQAVLPDAAVNLERFRNASQEKRRMYHGSKNPNITEFKTRKDMTDESNMTGHYADERDATFLSPDPEFTKNFSIMGYTDTNQAPTTYPVYVQVENPFDFDKPDHLNKVKEAYLDMFHNPDSDLYDPYILPSERSMAIHTFNKRVDSLPSDENNWARIENKDFQDVLKDLGFDSFYTRERGTKNLGVYDSNRIKSATGNRGTYDLGESDITKAKGGRVSMDAMRLAVGGGLTGIVKESAKAAARAAKAAEKAKKYATPAKFERAPAKTKEEIQAMAQRIAPQFLGEFVKKPGSTFSVAGKSMKQYKREKDLPIVYGGDRPTPNAFDVAAHEGELMVGVPGDPTIAHRTLEQIGDIKPETPVELHGGPLYGLKGEFWASGKGPATGLLSMAKRGSEAYQGAPVLGQYIRMPEGTPYALHTTDALLAFQRPDMLDKKKIALLNEEIRKGNLKNTFPEFVGFEDPDLVLLQAQDNPNLRKHINNVLLKPTTAQKYGLYPGPDIDAAITEAGLRNLETGVTGYSVGRLFPETKLKESAHPTYEFDIPGRMIGQTKYPQPYELTFPDALKFAREGLKPGVGEFGMLKMIGPRQIIDPQYVDEIKMYEEEMKRLTGKKKGGIVRRKKKAAVVKKAEGGQITSDDLVIEERKL